ncbi:hypothetical protein [Brevundimonas kwangchunensis]
MERRAWIDVQFSVWKVVVCVLVSAGVLFYTIAYQAPESGGRAIQVLYGLPATKVFISSVCSLALFGALVQLVHALSERALYRIRSDEIRMLKFAGYKTVVRGRWWPSEMSAAIGTIQIHNELGKMVVLPWLMVRGGRAGLVRQLRRALERLEGN